MQVGTLQQFAQQYNIHVTRGIRRFEKGVPATVELPNVSNQAPVIIQVTQDILEFKDMLFMNMTDIDQVRTPL
jgi:VPS28 protein